MTVEELAGKIDHTMLQADATTETIKRYCDEAKKYKLRVKLKVYNLNRAKINKRNKKAEEKNIKNKNIE